MFTRKTVARFFEDNTSATVTFTKVNGDKRVMTCTQDLTLVPEKIRPKPLKEGEEPKPVSDVTCTVYEFDKGWRSFRYASIISMETV